MFLNTLKTILANSCLEIIIIVVYIVTLKFFLQHISERLFGNGHRNRPLGTVRPLGSGGAVQGNPLQDSNTPVCVYVTRY